MLKFIQSITTAIKGASLTAKIIGVTTAVVVAGGTTAVIVVQANSSVQEPQDTETNDNSDKDTEQEKNEDKEENKDQDENLDNSDNQENKTDEQQTTNNNQTTNSGTTKPSSSGNSSQSGNYSSQQGTSQSTTQTQPAAPKAEFNLNNSIQIMQFGYTCNKFLGGDYSDPSNYVSAPGGGWIEISATGRRFSKGSGTCPDGYDLNGGAVPRVLDEYWCNLYGLSCDRW